MEGTSSDANHIFVDEFYFSALHDEDEQFPISDEKYAEELQLQEALMSSVISSRLRNDGFAVDEESENTNTLMRTLKGKGKETGGQSSLTFCDICFEAKSAEEIFRIQNCSHLFCADCIGKYVAAKIQENVSLVKCPEPKCSGILEPHLCRSIIPKQVFDRWEDALCESLILGSHKFYCPFKDCSAVLVDDGEDVVTASECPNCRRLFCAQCRVSWHAGVDCREFQNLEKGESGKEDLMVMELAKNKRWRRCPKCHYFVEKVEGCLHISCWCGNHFCYGCGSQRGEHHACRQEVD